MMDRLDAIRLFVRVAESGSFSAVAREANIGQPAVSKQVAALEAHLGAQLMHRTSRNLMLTEAGQAFYEAGVKLLSDLEAAEALVGVGQSRPSGLLRISLSAGFGRLHVVPQLPAFCSRYPDITVETLVSDRFVDLIEEGVDLAIRIGVLADSTLIARRIGATQRVTVASPAYLEAHGEPAGPHDLNRHACIAFIFQRQVRCWSFKTAGGLLEHWPKGAVRTNDAEHVRVAALAGMGIAQAPRWLFSSDLNEGRLREVLTDWPGEHAPISAVHPGGRRPPGKVRAFIEHLGAAFARDPELAPR
ncbi:MAG: LysR family transcriptional regulator [Beijerinckiaceae bacterium]|nr:LysR family transcriptional regulator [Beijerinckiaceae bacterium]